MQRACIERGIIIGGRIAGPALAMFLRRVGVDAAIDEARPDPARSATAIAA